MTQSSRRKSCQRRAPYRVAIQGEWLTLNRSNGQGYLLLQDPARGCKTRRYVGRLVAQDEHGEPVGDLCLLKMRSRPHRGWSGGEDVTVMPGWVPCSVWCLP